MLRRCLDGSFVVFVVEFLNVIDMKILNGKKKIEGVVARNGGDQPIGGEMCAIEGRLAGSYQQACDNDIIKLTDIRKPAVYENKSELLND